MQYRKTWLLINQPGLGQFSTDEVSEIADSIDRSNISFSKTPGSLAFMARGILKSPSPGQLVHNQTSL